MHQRGIGGEPFEQFAVFSAMTFTPTLTAIPIHSQGLEAQLRQCWAMYNAVPSEANRYQLVRMERLLQEI